MSDSLDFVVEERKASIREEMGKATLLPLMAPWHMWEQQRQSAEKEAGNTS